MPNTANYSFPTPADTDLVKNGADAIRDLGDAVDTAMNTALGTKKSGLVLLNTTSFSGVSSFSLAADTFTSTYDNYQIVFSNFTTTSNPNTNIKFRKAGVDNSASAYSIGGGTGAYGAGWTTFNTTGTSALLNQIGSANSKSSMELTIYDPKLNKATEFVTMSTSPTNIFYVGGIHDVVDTFDSMTFIYSAGNVSGTYSVYGFNK